MTILFHVGLQNSSLKVDKDEVNIMSKEQRKVLENVYNKIPYPSSTLKKKLSEDLNIEP